MIIECIGQKDWYEQEELEHIRAYHDNLQPLLGTYVVSQESVGKQAYQGLVPEQAAAETPLVQEPGPAGGKVPEQCSGGIHILPAGLDHANLDAIIDALLGLLPINEAA